VKALSSSLCTRRHARLVARRNTLAILALLVSVFFGSPGAHADDTVRIAACSPDGFDTSELNSVLARRVADGRVDYPGLIRDDKANLAAYLSAISGVSQSCYQSWTNDSRFAFWVNVYNAATLQVVVDHYPLTSIRSIGWIPGSAFREPVVSVPALRAEPYSLDDIENTILRPIFHDARVHFAIVCASVSCPALRSESYRGKDLSQLSGGPPKDGIPAMLSPQFVAAVDATVLRPADRVRRGLVVAEPADSLEALVAKLNAPRAVAGAAHASNPTHPQPIDAALQRFRRSVMVAA